MKDFISSSLVFDLFSLNTARKPLSLQLRGGIAALLSIKDVLKKAYYI
jgi:hypothetical protein